jgi:rhodanese-related sulfurtransferase
MSDFSHMRPQSQQQTDTIVLNSRFCKFMALFLWLFCLSSGIAAADQHALTPLDAQKLIEENRDNAKFVIIDLRTIREFDDGHIAGARQIHYYATNFMRVMSQLDRESTLLLYCQKGRQSPLAFRALQRLRFAQIYILDGGIEEWINAGLPTEFS